MDIRQRLPAVVKLHSSIVVLVVVLLPFSLFAQDSDAKFQDEQIEAPKCLQLFQPSCSSDELNTWVADLRHWRTEHLVRMGFDDAYYRQPALRWTQSSFVQPQMMVEDRAFYDPVARRYTVDHYLDDLEKRYGGIDSVLIWHTYTNIGIDNRNQYDMLRAMPGGIEGLRQMVSDFHRRGVRVLFPVMLWDQGTRDEGKPNWQATAELMKEIGADGVNGDTLNGVPLAFSKAADGIGHPLALEPESELGHDEMLAWNTMSWGYWTYPYLPSVSKYKWLVPAHMVNVCSRWQRDKTDNLQSAFFNGVGYESWENVWGIWNGITPRDGEALRRLATIERGVAEFLTSAEWRPYYPTLTYGVFASEFPRNQQTVWTLINRSQSNMNGQQLRLPHHPGTKYYDLYHGVELVPEIIGPDAILSLDVEAHGYGAIFATDHPADGKMLTLMQAMRSMTSRPLASFDHEWKFVTQHIVAIEPTTKPRTPPEGMVEIAAASFYFRVQGVELEGDNDVGVDVQYPWEDSPRRFHGRQMKLEPFWIDKYPVTNAQFRKFLMASSYRPVDSFNFLKDWKDGDFPSGWDNKPVTWISLEDARAYAKWAGKRLPHEWEWQYVAQGSDGRIYPWGNQWGASAVPAPEKDRLLRGPDDVNSHDEKGASPFGVHDLVGNVWQWTEEFQDEHTRSAILRGGSYYQPQGSGWYFPQAYRNDQHGKLLLMAPGKDRSGTVGFRCVMDALD